MKDKDYELSTEPKPNPMNIENLQEWMDMPLGSSQAIDDRLWWIIRVPGGWVLLATNGSCFVPEPKKVEAWIPYSTHEIGKLKDYYWPEPIMTGTPINMPIQTETPL